MAHSFRSTARPKDRMPHWWQEDGTTYDIVLRRGLANWTCALSPAEFASLGGGEPPTQPPPPPPPCHTRCYIQRCSARCHAECAHAHVHGSLACCSHHTLPRPCFSRSSVPSLLPPHIPHPDTVHAIQACASSP
ncbi:hypothetical protein OAO87_00675 [bacterium]|nr:hypothetical protein [bacterium]